MLEQPEAIVFTSASNSALDTLCWRGSSACFPASDLPSLCQRRASRLYDARLGEYLRRSTHCFLDPSAVLAK
jgi:hypothetical protein